MTHFNFLSNLTNCLLAIALGRSGGSASGHHSQDPQRKTKQEYIQTVDVFSCGGLNCNVADGLRYLNTRFPVDGIVWGARAGLLEEVHHQGRRALRVQCSTPLPGHSLAFLVCC